jgi:preprotein translocase subunit SecG
MAFFYPLMIVVHILVCAALIIVVLLQSSKGEGLAGAFGGGGGLSGAVFGGRGAATFLSKATTILAVCFMVTSTGLTILSLGVKSGGPQSGVIQNLKTGQSQQLPVTPSAVPGAAQPGAEQPGNTQPGAENGAGVNVFNQPPAQNQQPAAQPQQPATQKPSNTPAQTTPPASAKPGSGK